MAAEHDEHHETVLNLFDSFWFEHEILTSPNPPSLRSSKSQETIPQQVAEIEPAAALCRAPSFMVRSFSDQCLSPKNNLKSQTHSPKSVLSEPKLQPLLSGKEYLGFPESNAGKAEANSSGCIRRRRRKSFSELEFEEVKGFMDLGFVFSDGDKDSTLVSIIPGLQRLGVAEGGGYEPKVAGALVSRPYLSEAWSVMEEQRKKVYGKPLIKNWRMPVSGSTEMEIKDHLRCWAHSVASTVVR